MATRELILFPADSAGAPDAASIRETLDRIGLVGAWTRIGGDDYGIPGAEFLNLITFLGCAPEIRLGPPADIAPAELPGHLDDFCHCRLSGPHPGARLYFGTNTVIPVCPKCRTRLADWRQNLDAEARPAFICGRCGATSGAETLNWRKTACVCRFALHIGGIHPFEAVPGEALLHALQAATGFAWRHAYLLAPDPRPLSAAH